MGLGHVEPLKIALTGNSWHGHFKTVVFSPDDPNLIKKYQTLQTFPEEYSITWLGKTTATKFIANAVPPLAISNWLLHKGLLDYLPNRINIMIDLFSGIGGWALAFCYYLNMKPKHIIAVDYDSRALKAYWWNIPRLCGVEVHDIKRDIATMSIDFMNEYVNLFFNHLGINVVDVITISPPCESVSKANIHNNTCEPAISLTKKALEIIENIPYRLALFEEAPTRESCRNELEKILHEHGFKTEYVNLMKYGSLNQRHRLLAYKTI